MPAVTILNRAGRRITFEYSLVAGVNDTAEVAAELAELVRGINCHINLIPVNPIKERAIDSRMTVQCMHSRKSWRETGSP